MPAKIKNKASEAKGGGAPCSSGEVVALKIIKEGHAASAEDEIAVHEALREREERCPSIMHLREHFTVEGHVCMAMEMHGAPLYDIVEEAPLTLPEVKAITRQMAAALKELHEIGFAHTDVKTDNILYANGEAKLIDFGTADRKLKKGETFGTREYRAPEAILGCELDLSVDVWSLGCTVFELLTRDYLFDPHGSLWARREKSGKGKKEWARMKAAVAENEPEDGDGFEAGVVVGGKYELEAELGSGHFSTVWKASLLHEGPVKGEFTGRRTAGGVGVARPMKKERSRKRVSDAAAREARDLANRYDVLLDRELLGLMREMLGEIPFVRAREGKYFRRFYDKEGGLKSDVPVEKKPIGEALVEFYEFEAGVAEEIERFLMPMLEYDPGARAKPGEVLGHPWLSE